MNTNPNAPEIPLCVNVRRLQSYLLAPDEVALFDWFVVKQVSFKYKDFHYSQARIEEETRIKRTRQNVIINQFKEMGFLSSQVRENKETRGRVSFFKVDFEILSDPDVLSEIINAKEALFENFIKYMKHLCSEQKKALKSEKKDIFDQTVANRIHELLNETYEERRIMYNEGELTGNKPERSKSETQLQKNKIISKKLARLAKNYNENTIENAFIAYIDSVFKGETKPKSIMSHFLAYNDTDESFGVFEHSLDEFNLKYGRKNS